MVELCPEDAGFGPCGTRDGIDPDPFRQREIEHQPTVTDGIACHVVSAATHGKEEIVLPGEGDGGNDVGDTSTAHDSAGWRSIMAFQSCRTTS